MNLSALLALHGRKFATKPALIAPERQITYAEWNYQSNLAACHLRRLGIQTGDHVLLLMPNCIQFAISYFALMRAGAIVIPVQARSTLEDVLYICEHAEAKAVVIHEQLLTSLADLPRKSSLAAYVKTGASQDGWSGMDDWQAELSLPEEMKALSIDPEMRDKSEDDEVSMLYTSGTTGRPKGVLFTHRSLLTVGTMISVEMQLNESAKVLQLMPLSHSAPLHLFFVSSVIVGATQVLAPAFTPELLLQLTERHQVTHFFGAPVAYLLTARHPDFHRYDLSSVRFWIYGGAPLSKEAAELLEGAFGREKLVCVYGLTEAGPTGTCLRHAEQHHKAGSIGNKAVLFAELEVVDARDQPVQPGEPGEIRIRGEGSMKGYYKNQQATAETLRNGWIYTGDIARIDEDGYIWIIDRKKEMIISGGVNIFPKEIELELEKHPALKEVAVVGIPHPEWGETVVAFVVPKPLMAYDVNDWTHEVRRFLRGKIADYKIPRLTECIEALPRNASGKIVKHQLRELSVCQQIGGDQA